MMPVATCIPFPFFALCNDMLTMLVCATYWLSMHLYMLAYMSMHESCLLVCRLGFNTMKLWTFDPKPTFVPRVHHLLFAFLLVCLLYCLLAYLFAFLLSCLFVYLMACHVFCHMLCLPCLSCLSALCLFHMLFASFSFHCLFAGLLSLSLHVHTRSEGVWS